VARLVKREHCRFAGWLIPAIVGLNLCGCANFWDEMTRRDISFSAKFQGLFSSPDPLEVIAKSNDGNARAKALRSLREPKQHGGNDRDQDIVVLALVASATQDRQPLSRLAAVEALAGFKDPRAVQGLVDAYYKATYFAPETATVIQDKALTALGQTRHPAGVELLTTVLRAPAPAFDVPDQEKQQERDRRIAAARALGNFSHYQATEALVHVLKTEKDAALRNRATESLAQITGKDLPPDAVAWEKMLHQPPGQPSDRKFDLTGWFQKN
jgi:hypothetical protein